MNSSDMRELPVYALTVLGTDSFKLGAEVTQGEARGKVIEVVDGKAIKVALLGDAVFDPQSTALLTTSGGNRGTIGRVLIACSLLPHQLAYVPEKGA